MQYAIAKAVAVDEVKDLRDKAMALEKYAAQARNYEAEKRAAQIRITAEMKGGQLLKKLPKAKGAAAPGGKKNGKHGKITRSDGATACETLEDLHISKEQSSRWQQLAENPKASVLTSPACRAYGLCDRDRSRGTRGGSRVDHGARHGEREVQPQARELDAQLLFEREPLILRQVVRPVDPDRRRSRVPQHAIANGVDRGMSGLERGRGDRARLA
jgi:hypothetical protein